MPRVSARNAYIYLLVGVCLVAVLRAFAMLRVVPDLFAIGDNDNLLRLVQVRDWIGGQGWFDTTQYRLLPPEGVSIHWSRYIDLGIAAILVPLGWIFSTATAEALTLLLWPTVLLCIFMAIIGGTINRLSGWMAAGAAMLTALLWSKIGGGNFQVTSIDHHNVQMICAALIAAAMLPARNDLAGQDRAAILGGVAVGFSLAIGLEMLPYILIAWAYAGMRFAFGVAGAGRWLVVFALSVGLSALAFMAGQTPVADWMVAHCDVLATPILSLLATGIAVSVVPVALAGRITHPLARIALMAVLMAGGFWLAAPLLGPCLSGPYGSISPVTAAIIDKWITEAQPITAFAHLANGAIDRMLFPGLVLILAAVFLGWRNRRNLAPGEANAFVFLTLILGVGITLSFFQVRALNVAAAAYPLMAGLLAGRLVGLWHAGQQRSATLFGFAIMVVFANPALVTGPVRSLLPDGYTETEAAPAIGNTDDPDNIDAQIGASACRRGQHIGELDSLPPAVMATTINMGMSILAFSHHSATSAPYHRSADAFWNGIAPFERRAAMLGMLRKSGADYLVLCRVQDAKLPTPFVDAILKGDLPDWLIAVDPSGKGDASLLAVYRVDPAALAADPQQPETVESPAP